MCEFCSLPLSNDEREALHQDFAGFFSSAAIDAAVKEANALQQSQAAAQSKDDDGT